MGETTPKSRGLLHATSDHRLGRSTEACFVSEHVYHSMRADHREDSEVRLQGGTTDSGWFDVITFCSSAAARGYIRASFTASLRSLPYRREEGAPM